MVRFLLICVLVAACTPTVSHNRWPAPGWPDVVEVSDAKPISEFYFAAPDEGPWDAASPGPLSGFFAVEAVIKAKVSILTIETRQYLLLRLEQEGTHVRQKITVCELRLPSFEGLVQLEIPPAGQALIQSKAQTVTGEFLSADAEGAEYTTGARMVLVGAELSGDPMTDALPTPDSPPCPAQGQTCTLDEDRDDFPGITLSADLFLCEEGTEQLYIALRTVVDLKGIVGEGFNSLSGTVSPTLEWSVLGASDACLDTAASLEIEIFDNTDFKALRVDGRNGVELNLDSDGDGEVRCSDITDALEQELADWVTPIAETP